MKKDFYQQYFEVEKNHWLMVGRRLFLKRLLASLRDLPRREEVRILDVGCGSGYILGELQKEGYTWAQGVDMEEEAITFGTTQGIQNLQVSRTESIPFPNSSIDVVLSMDVVEHTPDDVSTLRELFRVVKPGGYVIIFVPAYMFLWGVQDEVAHHYRRYTMGRLIERVREVGGVSIVRRTYFNTFLFPLIALVRFVSWIFNLKARESDFDLNNKVLNVIFGTIFAIERFFLRKINLPFGVSIALVLRKDL